MTNDKCDVNDNDKETVRSADYALAKLPDQKEAANQRAERGPISIIWRSETRNRRLEGKNRRLL